MKKIAKLLLFALLLSLVGLPSFSLSATAAAMPSSAVQPVVKSATVIVVAMAAPTAVAVAQPAAKPDNSCSALSVSGGSLQGALTLNLNQPASCFTLSAVQPIVQPQKLIVRSAAQPAVRLAVTTGPAFAIRPWIETALPMAAAPAVASGMVLAVLLAEEVVRRRAGQTSRNTTPNPIFFPPSLAQLQILRC